MQKPAANRPPLVIGIDPYADTATLTFSAATGRSELPKGSQVQIWFESFIRDADVGAVVLAEGAGLWRATCESGADGTALCLTAEDTIRFRENRIDIPLNTVRIRNEEIRPVLSVVLTIPGETSPHHYRVAAAITRPRPLYRFPLHMAWLGERQLVADGRPRHFVLGLINSLSEPLVLPSAEDGQAPRTVTFELEFLSLKKLSFDPVQVSCCFGSNWSAKDAGKTQHDRRRWTLTFTAPNAAPAPVTMLEPTNQVGFLVEGIAASEGDAEGLIMAVLTYRSIPQYREGQYFLPLPILA